MSDVQTDFLFARPSILFGLARFLDFGGRFDAYNGSRSEAEADAKALLCDWYIVGQDLKVAIEKTAPTAPQPEQHDR